MRGDLTLRKRDERYEALCALGCMACRQLPRFRVPMRTEIHHQNKGGYAGQERLGDRYTIPLCGWHHRGQSLPSMTRTRMTEAYGPSLATSSKTFRMQFGSDAVLLARADELIRWEDQ